MTSTDPLNLDAIEARANAATPGPWRDADTHLGRHGHTATVLSGTGNDTDLRAWLPSLSQEAWDESRNVWADAAFIAAARTDVPALVAEVRRLRTELAAARRPDTPRLCECGHGHRAHTVPAPHSCFAFGQTCPCPAFRQLPHDQAVAQLEANRQAAAEREAARIAEEMRAVADDSAGLPKHEIWSPHCEDGCCR